MKKPSYHLPWSRSAAIVLVICLVLFGSAAFFLRSEKAPLPSGDYAEYENGKIITVLKDSTQKDPAADDAYRGEQLLIAEVTTGQYKGTQMQVYNYVGPLYGVPLKEGDGCTMIISTYTDGTVLATVYEYNRLLPSLLLILLFCAAVIFVGGRKGLHSLIGLAITVISVFLILFPALFKGAPTLLTTFLLCSFITVFTLILINGITPKSLCAIGGTVAGMLLALLFALLAQGLLRIDGLRIPEVEGLLQLRQTGSPLQLRGLLSAGVLISSLGAVMDVAMSLSSSLSEVHQANPSYGAKDLMRSGMNIGQDMVGTMTNTLILAFLGSSFTEILYISSLGLSFNQLVSSSYVAIELTTALASSIGVILSVPLTSAVCSAAYGGREL